MRAKHVAALGMTAALAVGGTTVAVGQGTGGTVGPGAVGTLDVTLVFYENMKDTRHGGINPAAPRDKTRPKIADLRAGVGDLIINGKKAGTVQGFDVTTYPGPTSKKYKGGAEFVEQNMIDFGNNDVLFVACRASDDERSNPCALTGGTGKYAGARGIVTSDDANVKVDRKRQIITVPERITFIP